MIIPLPKLIESLETEIEAMKGLGFLDHTRVYMEDAVKYLKAYTPSLQESWQKGSIDMAKRLRKPPIASEEWWPRMQHDIETITKRVK